VGSDILALLALVLFFGGLVALILRGIGLTATPAYLISGMILSSTVHHLPPKWQIDQSHLEPFIHLGLVFMLFNQGLELSTAKLKRMGSSTFLLGISQTLLTALAVFIIWGFFREFSAATWAIAGALAFSSTGSIIKFVEEKQLGRQSFAKNVIGVLLIEDILAIFVLASLPTLVSGTGNISMSLIAGELIIFSSLLWLAGGVLGPKLTLQGVKRGGAELLLVLSVGLCLIIGEIFAQQNLSPALGAFIVGMLLAETKEIAKIRVLIDPIKQLFVAIFFVAFGMKFNPEVFFSGTLGALILFPAILFGKFAVPLCVGLWNRKSFEESLNTALMLPQIGEFSIIIALAATKLKIISNEELAAIMVLSLCSLICVPKILENRDKLNFLGKKASVIRFSMWLQQAGEKSSTGVGKFTEQLRFSNALFNRMSQILHRIYVKSRTGSKSGQLARLTPWDDQLIEITAESGSKVIGRALIELGLRDQFGISVVALEREGEVYVSPEPSFRILPWDILLIYGDTLQSEKAELLFQRRESRRMNNGSKLADCVLEQITLDHHHPYIGNSLKELDLRAKFGIMVLAIIRNEVRERNPSPSFVFEKNDQVFYVLTKNFTDSPKSDH
jgi:Kef-type K+ transport system membrane component KefB/Trk K+ transport system NAD-binding subunit